MFNEDYDKHIHILNKIGYSYVASSGSMFLNKIKPEKYKSLEERCIDLKKMFDTYYFEPRHYTVTDMVIDFIQSANSQFVMLQIKDYQCQPLKWPSKSSIMSNDKEKDGVVTCEGAICKFIKQSQIDELVNRLVNIGLISKNRSKIGRNVIKTCIISSYNEDNILY